MEAEVWLDACVCDPVCLCVYVIEIFCCHFNANYSSLPRCSFHNTALTAQYVGRTVDINQHAVMLILPSFCCWGEIVVVMSAVIFMILSNFLSRFKRATKKKLKSKKLSQSFTTSAALIAVCCSNLWSENYALPTTHKKKFKKSIRKGHVHRRNFNNWVTSFTSLALIRLFETSLRLMETNGECVIQIQ